MTQKVSTNPSRSSCRGTDCRAYLRFGDVCRHELSRFASRVPTDSWRLFKSVGGCETAVRGLATVLNSARLSHLSDHRRC